MKAVKSVTVRSIRNFSPAHIPVENQYNICPVRIWSQLLKIYRKEADKAWVEVGVKVNGFRIVEDIRIIKNGVSTRVITFALEA